MDARELRLMLQIATLFMEENKTSKDPTAEAVALIAQNIGFAASKVYLDDEATDRLIEQGATSSLELTGGDNPFVTSFMTQTGRFVNVEPTETPDPYFGQETAFLLPLGHDGQKLGVFSLWQLTPAQRQLTPLDRELGLGLAGHISRLIASTKRPAPPSSQ